MAIAIALRVFLTDPIKGMHFVMQIRQCNQIQVI